MITSKELDKNEVSVSVPYTDDERAYFQYVSERVIKALNLRSKPYRELNDMDYITRYESNQDNFLAYTRKRRNEEERLLVTGVTRMKGKSLLSALLSYNLMPNFVAFDKNNDIIEELGSIMNDLVKKSYEIEEYDKKRPLIYNEALAQGTWFVEELYLQKMEVRKKMTKELDVEKISSAKWKEEKLMKPGVCVSRLVPGKKVYLGNIQEFFMDNQPYAFTVDILDYNDAVSIFGEWERWQYVPRKVLYFDKQSGGDSKVDDGVEVIKYYDPIKNEFQIFCNSVMMLPPQYPLTEVSPSGKIPLAKGDIDPTRWEFAYSKSFTDDMMFDQGLLDDFIRILVFKAQQHLMPPLVNNTNRVLGRRIFLPGMITSNINPNLLQPLIPTPGVTAPDVQMFEIIRRLVDEKSVSPQFTGDAQLGRQTATEIIELKKQQMMKLGLLIWGIMEFEKSHAMLRLYNILSNWTKPVDQAVDKLKKRLVNVYQSFTVETEDREGAAVHRVIEFSPEKAQLPSDFLMREEDYLSVGQEKPVRFTYIDPEWLRNLNANWFVSITPTEKDTSELNRVLFMKNITEGMQLFGPQAFNIEYLKQRWAILNKEDPNRLFIRQEIAPPKMLPEGVAPGGRRVEAELMQGIMPPAKEQQIPLQTLLGMR